MAQVFLIVQWIHVPSLVCISLNYVKYELQEACGIQYVWMGRQI